MSASDMGCICFRNSQVSMNGINKRQRLRQYGTVIENTEQYISIFQLV
jgi:hypothetical protein